MTETDQAVAELLHEAAETHHVVYHALVQLDRDHADTGGGEPWEAFYARGLRERLRA